MIMNKKEVLCLSVFLLLSCSSVSTSHSESVSSENVRTEVRILENFKASLLSLDCEVNSKSYRTEQTDNYYGLDMESAESGTVSRYKGDFIAGTFTQTIVDQTIEGQRQIGVTDLVGMKRLYNLVYYGEGEEGNKISYYSVSDKESLFNLGFVKDYVSGILDVTLTYYADETKKLSLNTNFSEVEFPENGTTLLQYRFICFESNGINKAEEVERDDELEIRNGKIVSSKTTMLYALSDGINYRYMESRVTYGYEETTEFTGEKIDPAEFS